MQAPGFVTATFCLFAGIFPACSESPSPSPVAGTSVVSTAVVPADSLEGFWNTVYFEESGKSMAHAQVKVFHHGKFMLINRDSHGQLAYAAHGTYEIRDGTYKETFRFFGNGLFTGWSDWQEWSMSGDTLVMKGYTRVQKADGSDDTKNWKPFVEKRLKLR
jgi:hypothetical protein